MNDWMRAQRKEGIGGRDRERKRLDEGTRKGKYQMRGQGKEKIR